MTDLTITLIDCLYKLIAEFDRQLTKFAEDYESLEAPINFTKPVYWTDPVSRDTFYLRPMDPEWTEMRCTRVTTFSRRTTGRSIKLYSAIPRDAHKYLKMAEGFEKINFLQWLTDLDKRRHEGTVSSLSLTLAFKQSKDTHPLLSGWKDLSGKIIDELQYPSALGTLDNILTKLQVKK
jgi:hypothetical protein